MTTSTSQQRKPQRPWSLSGGTFQLVQATSVSSVTRRWCDHSSSMLRLYGTTVWNEISTRSRQFSGVQHASLVVTTGVHLVSMPCCRSWIGTLSSSDEFVAESIRHDLVAISASVHLQPVPTCTRGFETRYMQIQCNINSTYSQSFFLTQSACGTLYPSMCAIVTWQHQGSSVLHPVRLVVSGRVFIILHKHCFYLLPVHPVITALFNFHGTQLFSACGAILHSIELAPLLEDENDR